MDLRRAPLLECGAYFPIVSYSRGGRLTLDGAELRALWVPPAVAGERFFYGANVALRFNSRDWSERRLSGEVQPIVGGRWGAFTLALNPSVSTGFDGTSKVEFSPSERLGYALSSLWTLALEHYAELGALCRPEPIQASGQQVFAVAQRRFGGTTVEAGAGWGLTTAAEHLTLKLVVSFDL